MRVVEAVANMLVEAGIERAFGLIGDGNLRLVSYLYDDLDIPFYCARHESAAVAMADAYARTSGRLGLATVTQGPGLTNATTALVSAKKGHTPMLFMVGDVPPTQSGWPQDIDQLALFAALGLPAVQILDKRNVATDLHEAITLARSTSQPVAVNMPLHIQESEWEPWDTADSPQQEPATAPAAIAEDLIARSCALLEDAKRPVIVAGRGVHRAGCRDELAALGDDIGALLATTLGGKGLYDRHDFFVGLCGSLGTNLGAKLIGEADVVLVVGAGLNDFTTLRNQIFDPSATIVRCDIDRVAFERRPDDIQLVGDAARTVSALRSALRQSAAHKTGYRTDDVRDQLALERTSGSGLRPDPTGGLHPETLVRHLDQLLPPDRVVVTDTGQFFGYPSQHMSVMDPQHYVPGVDFGAVGLGMGLAIGAAAGRPEALTVLFIGDGGLMMNLGEFETAARYEIPLLVIVMNDNAYGSELQIARVWGLPESGVKFENPPLEKVATDLGGDALVVRNVSDLGELSNRVTSMSRPLLVNCLIDQNVIAGWLEEAFSR